MTRIATFASHNLSNLQNMETRARINQGQIQVSSGKKAQQYAGIAGDTNRLLGLETARTETKAYVRTIDTTQTRVSAMENNLQSLFDAASSFRQQLVNARNDHNADHIAMKQMAEDMMDEVAGLMNLEMDGRYLFGGHRTDTAPVDLDAAPFNPDAAGYSPDDDATGYYMGDDGVQRARIAEGHTVDYGITADEEAIDLVFRGLHEAAKATEAGLEAAHTLFDQAVDRLPDLQSKLAATSRALEDAKARHQNFDVFAADAIGKVEDADVAETITQITQDQSSLQASYAVTARLGRLSLLNYL